MATLRAGDPIRSLAALTVRPVIELPLKDGEDPPKEFRIFSVGVNATEKGPFLWDALSASTCMSFWKGKGVHLSMDWEHQALADPPIQAPASAWWTPEIRDGELWATDVKWTPVADSQIRKKEYRYFSPAFTFDAVSTRPERIINAALTNIPAMDRIEPLVAANAIAAAAIEAKETTDMDELAALKAKYDAQTAKYDALSAEVAGLRTQLASKSEECTTLTAKLSAVADEDKETSTAVGLRFDAPKDARKSAIVALTVHATKVREITGQASDAAAVATLTTWKADAAEVVALRTQIADIETRTIAAEFKGLMDGGESDGRIPPGEDNPIRKSVMTAYLGIGGGKPSSAGIAWLRGHIPTMGKIVGGTPTVPNAGAGPSGVLSASRLQILRQMGRDPKAVEEFETKRLQSV